MVDDETGQLMPSNRNSLAVGYSVSIHYSGSRSGMNLVSHFRQHSHERACSPHVDTLQDLLVLRASTGYRDAMLIANTAPPKRPIISVTARPSSNQVRIAFNAPLVRAALLQDVRYMLIDWDEQGIPVYS